MSEKEEEGKFEFRPGYRAESIGTKNSVTIQIFEQLANGKYVYGLAHKKMPSEPSETYDESIQTTVSMPDGNCAPIDKAPWPLVEKPLPYTKELWAEIRTFIYEHLFLPDENLYDVLTAWVIASWVYEVWSVVPYIFFYGPVASGKTRGLEILHRLAYRPILSSNISSAALFRACEAWKPTLILDETEIYNKQERNEIIGLLNSGYRRGAFAIRVKTTEHGEVLECFNVFGFKALAGTEGLAKTLESRSIMIRMLKNRRKVRLHIDEKKAEELRAKLLSWRLITLTSAELSELSEVFLAKVQSLDFASGRLEELFQCLLAVSNDGHDNILKYAQKMVEMQMFEEMTSLEAELIESMLESSLEVQNNVILTKSIAERMNKNRLEKEKLKTNSVGWIIRRLGFEPRHTDKGNGWYYDEGRIKYLKSIYLGDREVAKKGSETSETSVNKKLDLGTPFFDACYFCQKPIWTEDYVTDDFTAHKPAHRECYDQTKKGVVFGEALSSDKGSVGRQQP